MIRFERLEKLERVLGHRLFLIVGTNLAVTDSRPAFFYF